MMEKDWLFAITSSTDPAVDDRYSAYFLFDDPILDDAVIQADKIFEDHRILSSVKIDLCQMFNAMSISSCGHWLSHKSIRPTCGL